MTLSKSGLLSQLIPLRISKPTQQKMTAFSKSQFRPEKNDSFFGPGKGWSAWSSNAENPPTPRTPLPIKHFFICFKPTTDFLFEIKAFVFLTSSTKTTTSAVFFSRNLAQLPPWPLIHRTFLQKIEGWGETEWKCEMFILVFLPRIMCV